MLTKKATIGGSTGGKGGPSRPSRSKGAVAGTEYPPKSTKVPGRKSITKSGGQGTGRGGAAGLGLLARGIDADLKKKGLVPGTAAYKKARANADIALAGMAMRKAGKPGRPGAGAGKRRIAGNLSGLSAGIEADLKKKGLKPGTAAYTKARNAANNNLVGISQRRPSKKRIGK